MLENIAKLLEDHTSFVIGDTLQYGYTPENAPIRHVVLLERTASNTYWQLKDRVDFILQVISRAKNYNDAKADSKTIYEFLHNKCYFPLFPLETETENEVLLNNGFEDWTNPLTLAAPWVQTITAVASINQESTIKDTGSYSARFYAGTGNISMYQQIALTADLPYQLIMKHLNPDGGFCQWQINCYNALGGLLYGLSSGGVWTPGTSNLYPDALTEWGKTTVDFTGKNDPLITGILLIITKIFLNNVSFYFDSFTLKSAKYFVNFCEAMNYPQYIGMDEHGSHQFSTNYVFRLQDMD